MCRSPSLTRVCCGLCLVLLLPALAPAQVADVDRNASPSSGALSDSDWFDSEQERLLPVTVTTQQDDTMNRDSRWLPQPKRVRSAKTAAGGNTATGGGGGGPGLFGSGMTLGNVFGWLLLAVLIGLAVYLIAYALSKSEFDFASGSPGRASRAAEGPDQQTLERMKHLPAELRRTDVNFRTEAERLMRQGDFDQAIILLFAHQLLLLDRAGMLRLNRGKTNRRYVRETRGVDRESADRLQRTVHLFERSYFGRHTITDTEFERLWRENEVLEQAIQRRQEVAA